MGKMHAGRVVECPRLQEIVRIMKGSDHPMTQGAIGALCYPNSTDPDKRMGNVSTYIGEIRAQVNQDDGYLMSYSTRWTVAKHMPEVPKRTNADNSITYFIPVARYPWHDARPRYWLMAAPGWRPSWYINDAGLLVSANTKFPALVKALENAEQIRFGPLKACINPRCQAHIQEGGPPFCRSDVCKKYFFENLQVKMF